MHSERLIVVSTLQQQKGATKLVAQEVKTFIKMILDLKNNSRQKLERQCFYIMMRGKGQYLHTNLRK